MGGLRQKLAWLWKHLGWALNIPMFYDFAFALGGPQHYARVWGGGGDLNDPSLLRIGGGAINTLNVQAMGGFLNTVWHQVFYSLRGDGSQHSCLLRVCSQNSKCCTNLGLSTPSVLRVGEKECSRLGVHTKCWEGVCWTIGVRTSWVWPPPLDKRCAPLRPIPRTKGGGAQHMVCTPSVESIRRAHRVLSTTPLSALHVHTDCRKPMPTPRTHALLRVFHSLRNL